MALFDIVAGARPRELVFANQVIRDQVFEDVTVRAENTGFEHCTFRRCRFRLLTPCRFELCILDNCEELSLEKEPMKDLMVDLETLGTGSDAVIVQIGACYFNRHTAGIGRTFQVNIDPGSCQDEGLTIDGGTVEFWMDNADKATWRRFPHYGLVEALDMFSTFVGKSAVKTAWASAGFDFPILASAYRACDMRNPIRYRMVRDLRTLVDLAKMTDPRAYVRTDAHDALADCKYQVGYASICFRRLKAAGL